jgi:hypothetical protein
VTVASDVQNPSDSSRCIERLACRKLVAASARLHVRRYTVFNVYNTPTAVQCAAFKYTVLCCVLFA